MRIVFNDTKEDNHSHITKLIDITLKAIMKQFENNDKYAAINIYADDDTNKVYGIYIADHVEIVNYGNNHNRISIYSLLKHKHPFKILSKDDRLDELNGAVDDLIDMINICRSFRDDYKNKNQSMNAISMLSDIIYGIKDIAKVSINMTILDFYNSIDFSRDIYNICSPSVKSYSIAFLDKDSNIINSDDTKILEALLAVIILTTRRYKKRMIKNLKLNYSRV